MTRRTYFRSLLASAGLFAITATAAVAQDVTLKLHQFLPAQANVPKLMGAPLTVIVAYDVEFWRELPKLFPHEDRRGHFSDKPAFAEETAFRNSTLQGGYLMIAARAIGLDVGAMSGFSNQVVDEEFFDGTTLKSNFLCNIGYADESALFQRLPRFAFDEVCEFA